MEITKEIVLNLTLDPSLRRSIASMRNWVFGTTEVLRSRKAMQEMGSRGWQPVGIGKDGRRNVQIWRKKA